MSNKITSLVLDSLLLHQAVSAAASFLQVLQDLGLPHFHHELVKAAVELSFEHPDKAQQLTALLRQLSETGVISSTQLAQVTMQAAPCFTRDCRVLRAALRYHHTDLVIIYVRGLRTGR